MLLIIISCIFAAVSVGIWSVFLRPVPRHSIGGVIASETLKPAGTEWQYPPGIDRGMRMPNEIPVAESYVFAINIDGMSEPAYYALNTIASQQFQVRQRVELTIEQRAVPPFWRRLYVLEMTAGVTMEFKKGDETRP